jgi:hypothetical protein
MDDPVDRHSDAISHFLRELEVNNLLKHVNHGMNKNTWPNKNLELVLIVAHHWSKLTIFIINTLRS